MTPYSLLLMMVVAALTLVSAPMHASTEESRPRLEQFASYNDFLKAMVTWEARNQQTAPAAPALATTPPAAPAPAQPSTRPIPVPDGIDPTSETAPPPLAITGPEDLEVAVELAKDITHPDYKAPIRYNRSTHISFPLPTIDGSDMSQASIPGSLQAAPASGDRGSMNDVTNHNARIEALGDTKTTQIILQPDSYAGMSPTPVNGPRHIVVESLN